MSVEDVLSEAGVKADVEHSDASAAMTERCDYIVTTSDIAKLLQGAKGEVIVCNSFIDKVEIKRVLVNGGVIS
jgi:PTS system ascorbate-specific IIB component